MLSSNLEVMSWSTILIRIGFALLAGLLIGLERELSNHPAGIKTHVLVCLGAALSSLMACEMGLAILKDITAGTEITTSMRVDLSRIASGVITGIGFIGAGAIMKSRDGTMVTGITTAATLWVTACLGLAIGMGYFKMSLVTFISVFIANTFLKTLETRFLLHRRVRGLELTFLSKEETMNLVGEYFEARKIKVMSFEYIGKVGTNAEERNIHHCKYLLRTPKSVNFVLLVQDIAAQDNIIQAYESSPSKAMDTEFSFRDKVEADIRPVTKEN